MVIQYFGFIYVAFLANYAPLFPGEHCPNLNCLPVLTIMLLTETILVTSYQVSYYAPFLPPPPRPGPNQDITEHYEPLSVGSQQYTRAAASHLPKQSRD